MVRPTGFEPVAFCSGGKRPKRMLLILHCAYQGYERRIRGVQRLLCTLLCTRRLGGIKFSSPTAPICQLSNCPSRKLRFKRDLLHCGRMPRASVYVGVALSGAVLPLEVPLTGGRRKTLSFCRAGLRALWRFSPWIPSVACSRINPTMFLSGKRFSP